MLSREEENFIVYWQENRNREKSIFKQISGGLWIGLVIGIAIIASYASGWYTRANMVANSQSTPLVLLIAIIIIAVFCSIFYKRHRWDMNESYYQTLLKKKDVSNLAEQMQQESTNNSQVK